MRTYSELIKLPTFEERFRYLMLSGQVGRETFGVERYLNQAFYHSREWRNLRTEIIVRDSNCDLGCPGYEIAGSPIIHHMNPITIEDFDSNIERVLDPEYLITVSSVTHRAITYGMNQVPPRLSYQRTKYDTCPWKKKEENI